jgi:hypothetical protein
MDRLSYYQKIVEDSQKKANDINALEEEYNKTPISDDTTDDDWAYYQDQIDKLIDANKKLSNENNELTLLVKNLTYKVELLEKAQKEADLTQDKTISYLMKEKDKYEEKLRTTFEENFILKRRLDDKDKKAKIKERAYNVC